MKCFYHHDRDAVALCYSCNRGLCPDCAVEVSDRLACRDRCEAAVGRATRVGQAGLSLVEQTDRAQGVARLAQISLTMFVLMTGVLISALGYTRWPESPTILLLGIVLVVFGLVLGFVLCRWHDRPRGTG